MQNAPVTLQDPDYTGRAVLPASDERVGGLFWQEPHIK
jgi:hypothetical protein